MFVVGYFVNGTFESIDEDYKYFQNLDKVVKHAKEWRDEVFKDHEVDYISEMEKSDFPTRFDFSYIEDGEKTTLSYRVMKQTIKEV